MNGDELGPVGKRAFYLNFVDHLRDAVGHVGASEQPSSKIHQLRNRSAITNELEQLRRDERDRLRVVQSNAAGQALLREHAGLMEHQLVEFSWGQMHT